MKFFNTALLLLCAYCTAFSQTTTTWNGNADINWNNSANWSNGLPAAGKAAVVPLFVPSLRMPTISQALNMNFDVYNNGVITVQARTDNYGKFENQLGAFVRNRANFYNHSIFNNRAVFENGCTLGCDTTGKGFINAAGGTFTNYATVINKAKFIIGGCSTAYFNSPTKANLAGDIRLEGIAYVLQGTVDFATQAGTALFSASEYPTPSVSAKNISVQLDANGNATVTPQMVDDQSETPYCGTPTLSLSPTTFTCTNVGDNTVTLTATDSYGHTASTQATVTVLASPICYCTALSSAGTIGGYQYFCPGDVPAPVINLTTPNGGSGTYQYQWQKTTTDPATTSNWANISGATNLDYQMGPITQTTWYRRMAWGVGCQTLVAISNVQQIIWQNPMPTAVCVPGIIVAKPATGPAVVAASQLNGGSVAGCNGIASITLSQNSFSSIGVYSVNLLVANYNGDVAVCPTIVDVRNTPVTGGMMPNCPTTNVQVTATSAAGAVATYSYPTATTNCISGVSYNLVSGLPSGSVFPVGESQVCYQTTDACGGNTTCCFTVKVNTPTGTSVWTNTQVNGCITVKLINIANNAQGQPVYSYEVKNDCANAVSNVAFALPSGVKAASPANNTTYTAGSGRQYTVENTTSNPFYSIKLNTIGEGIKSGQKEVFNYNLPTGTARMTSIKVSVKYANKVNTLTLVPVQQSSSPLIAPKFAMQLNAFPKTGKVQVNYQSKIAKSVDEYRVQRSSDDLNWETIGTEIGGGDDGQTNFYSFLDENPLPGANHYRIQARLRLGLDWETETVLVRMADEQGFSVFPNPATDFIFMDLSELAGKSATVNLTDVHGRVLRTVQVEEVSAEPLKIDLLGLPSGLVNVQVESEGIFRNQTAVIGLR